MTRPAWALAALALACAASGCRSHRSTRTSDFDRGAYHQYSCWHPAHEPREAPRLDLSDEQLARALERSNVKAARRHEEALDVAARARGGSVATLAAAMKQCYQLGDRDTAADLASANAAVREWDGASELATVECVYRQRGHGGSLQVTVRRKPGVEGPIAIAFPPGTYGVAADGRGDRDDHRWTNPDDDRRYGKWPSQQDLALLSAPVVYLAENQSDDSITVPVACASFESGPPSSDQRYVLHRFEPGSKIDRLVVGLCAREHTSEPEAQLAVWLARNDISWSDFVSKGGDRGGLLTFGSSSRITPRHGKGAARLLIESGVNPGYSPFFADHKTLVEEAPAPPEQPVAPEGPTQ